MSNLTVEKYVELKKAGKTDSAIRKEFGLHNNALTKFKKENDLIGKYNTHSMKASEKSKINTYQKYDEILAERDKLRKELEVLKSTEKPTVHHVNIDYKAKYEELSKAYENLVHEVEEAESGAKELDRWKELFETAMADKEQLQKENLLLENQIQRLKEVNDELKEKSESYFDSLMRLEQEVKGLRIYALQKLHIDVYKG